MTTRAPYPYGPQDGQTADSGAASKGPGGRGGGRRYPVRRLLPLGVAAWAVLEIWLLTLVGEAAGGLTVLALLVAGFVLGALAVKRAGRRAWRDLSRGLQQAQAQAAGEADGEKGEQKDPRARTGGGNALAMLGGLLLMVPGLVSDAAGLLCLFPPTARLMRGAARRRLERGGGFASGGLGEVYQQARIHRPDGKVVQGEVVRDDEPPAR